MKKPNVYAVGNGVFDGRFFEAEIRLVLPFCNSVAKRGKRAFDWRQQKPNPDVNYDFTPCKYSAAELNGKTANINIQLAGGGFYAGEAKFEAVQNERGFIRLAALCPVWEKDYSSVSIMRHFIAAEALDKIVKNPNGSKCEFSLDAIGGNPVQIADLNDWNDNRFSVEDLDGKRIDVALLMEDGRPYYGEGFLQAVTNGKFIHVRIAYPKTPTQNKAVLRAAYYSIPAAKAHKLVRNPEGSKNLFSFKDL